MLRSLPRHGKTRLSCCTPCRANEHHAAVKPDVKSRANELSREAQVVLNPSKDDAITSFSSFDLDSEPRHGNTVAIIGAGSVGAATATAIIHERAAAKILLVDLNKEKCLGEAMDLSDAACLAGCSVLTAEPREAGQADLIIITAGAKQRPGEPRSQLIDRNVTILTSVINGLKPFGDNTLLMIVANPVDILTTIAQKISNLPKHRVLGSGTFLDSMRLRSEVGKLLGVASSSCHVTVVGEHGDSQVAAWSCGSVGGRRIETIDAITPEIQDQLAEYSKRKAYEIINRKGSTFFGIAACAATITRAALYDTSQIIPLSSWSDKYQMYISQPCIIGETGIKETLPLMLTEDEQGKLDASAAAMRAVLDGVQY